MKKYLILGLCLFMGIGSVSAQVTIGSGMPPNKGALLDLKDGKGTGDATAVKGLGLPRVELKTLNPDLNKLAESIGGTSGTTPWDEDAHTGLIVYNVKPVSLMCLKGEWKSGIASGIHVWDGKAWKSLLQGKAGAIDVRTVSYPAANKMKMEYIVDGVSKESEEYDIADFGTAGTWMTQNLRTQYSPDGKKLPMSGKQTTPGVDDSGKPHKMAAYPGQTADSDPTLYNKNINANPKIEIGFLYDWFTATDYMNCAITTQTQEIKFSENSGLPGDNEVETVEETEPGKKDGKIKGICPQGWHLPSDREFNLLEKELTENADNYANGSYTTAQKTWVDGWETKAGTARGIAGQVMKSTSEVKESSYPLSNADSKPSSTGGFSVIVAGNASSGKGGGYGQVARIWTSSSNNGYKSALYRTIKHNEQGINRTSTLRFYMCSVRCKKD